MSIDFPALPYATNALVPHMSQRTLEIHYGKHHRKYVEKANELIKGTSYELDSIEEIMFRSFERDPQIYNNVAQAWNHGFFWQCLAQNVSPSEKINRMIDISFGGMDKLQSEFNRKALGLFGSGWIWLVRDASSNLAIRALSNADNPMVHSEIPILACDVWEHAYYLDYQSNRGEYLRNFWSIVNWEFVEANLNRVLPRFERTYQVGDDLTTPKEFEKARADHH